MIDAALVLEGGRATRTVDLAAYLEPGDAEAAAARAHGWIKALRHVPVDGEPLRRRFTFRGDSLWWFTELYLHKQQVVLRLFETLAALRALVDREAPRAITLVHGDEAATLLAPQVARQRAVQYHGPALAPAEGAALVKLDARAAWLHAAALASRLRPRPRPAASRGAVAVFVHSAFWNADAGDGSAEAYIGPVLQALERRIGAGGVYYVGIGPRTNFRARRWWDPLRAASPGSAVPVEAFAPLDRLRPSRRVWRRRHDHRRTLWASDGLRQHAGIDGCDAWPVVQRELAGVALLQWPWSTRVWDEADAALDALQPRSIVTYAEAGGWGRALVLASRQRGIPSIGIQHGFIYRHWLNYLHEPDEVQPEAGGSDRGFPYPSATLVFDRYASRHLTDAARLPADSVVVTGSPRLDDLVRAFAAAPDARAAVGGLPAGPDTALILLTTKFREARRVLGPLLDAVARLPNAHLAIKTHPAETPELYRAAVGDRACATVLPASAPLAPLLRACRVVVTVNSTVALDAAVLGVPALVIGLPNNLSPFVEAGMLAGAAHGEIETALRRILYDEELRRQVSDSRRAVLDRFAMASDGRAAERAADAILERSAGTA